MRSISVGVVLLGVSLSGAAHAQMFRAACHVDTLCPGVERGGGKVVACLRTHKSELTEQCFAALGRFMINRNPQGQGRDRKAPSRRLPAAIRMRLRRGARAAAPETGPLRSDRLILHCALKS